MSLKDDIAKLRDEGRLTEVVGLVPYATFMGVQSYWEGEQLIARLPYRDDHIGNFTANIFHGGLIGALLEHTAFMHLLHHVRRNHLPKIVNISANYLRPVAPQDVLANGLIVRQGARVANVRVRAWQKAWDDPVATADVHFLLPKRGAAEVEE